MSLLRSPLERARPVPGGARPWSAWIVAVAATAVAVLVRWLLEPLLAHRLPFSTMYAAVAVAVWVGGWRPALFAAILGFVSTELLFVKSESASPLSFQASGGFTGAVLYGLTTAVVIALGSATRSARFRAQAKEMELEQVTNLTPLMLTRCSADRRLVFVNHAYAAFIGRRVEDLLGRPIAEVIGAAAAAAIEPSIERVLRGEPVEFEQEIPYADLGSRVMRVTYAPDVDARGATVGWFATIEDVTAHRRAEQALVDSQAHLAGEARMLNDLHSLSSRLWRMSSLREGLEEMLAATLELLRADKGNVQLLDAERGVLRIAAQRGFEQPFLDFFREVSVADGSACGRALRSRERTVVADVETESSFAPLLPVARSAGFRAVQSTPLLGRDGAVLGMISTHWRATHRPDERELRWLDLYARQCAYFVERCKADDALRESDRRKDEFLAVLAHELRNPLAPVANAIQVLRQHDPAPPELRWAREVIHRQVQQMTHLIDDLMDVSRITHNKLELRKEPVDLAELLRGAIETSRPLLEAGGHALAAELPREPLVVDADATRLAQVFANLLSNAAKYSAPGTAIGLSARRDGGDAVVTVRDEGIGIPAELLPHLFDGFARATPWPKDRPGGLGVGLSLVKRLVEMHGGGVQGASAGPGRGSEFVVRLPLAPAGARLGPARDAEPKLAAARVRRRVLVADDNRDSAESMARMLGLLGYEARTAADGVEAVQVADEFRPEVVLLDLGMPRMDGCEVAQRLRASAWARETLLVAVTGWGQATDRQRTRAAGFDHHLVKPVDLASLSKLLAVASPAATT